MAGAWSRIGSVRSVNPAKRELRIDPTRPFANGAKGMDRVRIALRDNETMLCTVDSVSANPAGLIVTLGAGVSRDAVARMKGARVEAERQRQLRDTVAPDEMDAADWIGLDVVSVDGTRIGTIAGCIESPAHDILEIETADGQNLLLPAIDETVESIDLETRCVVIGNVETFGIRDAN